MAASFIAINVSDGRRVAYGKTAHDFAIQKRNCLWHAKPMKRSAGNSKKRTKNSHPKIISFSEWQADLMTKGTTTETYLALNPDQLDKKNLLRFGKAAKTIDSLKESAEVGSLESAKALLKVAITAVNALSHLITVNPTVKAEVLPKARFWPILYHHSAKEMRKSLRDLRKKGFTYGPDCPVPAKIHSIKDTLALACKAYIIAAKRGLLHPPDPLVANRIRRLPNFNTDSATLKRWSQCAATLVVADKFKAIAVNEPVPKMLLDDPNYRSSWMADFRERFIKQLSM